jgi:hypothetical protein
MMDTDVSKSHAESSNLEWTRFMAQLEAAEEEFVRNQPAAFKALWSRSEDVSIYGAFGGIVSGRDEVARRLDWASAAFSDGTRTRQEISVVRCNNLAHIVQVETIRYRTAGRSSHATLSLRVSMACRLEREGWRVFHRHADPMVDVVPPQRRSAAGQTREAGIEGAGA